jgi:hypothetical protein
MRVLSLRWWSDGAVSNIVSSQFFNIMLFQSKLPLHLLLLSSSFLFLFGLSNDLQIRNLFTFPGGVLMD